jgi:hypothetical protein
MKSLRLSISGYLCTLICFVFLVPASPAFSQESKDSESAVSSSGGEGFSFESGSNSGGDGEFSFEAASNGGGDGEFSFESASNSGGGEEFSFESASNSGGDGEFSFESASSGGGDEGFGFGFDGGGGGGFASAAESFTVKVGGSVSAGITSFVDDWSDASKTRLGDIFSGALKVSANSSNADALIALKVAPDFDNAPGAFPIQLDEGYLRFYAGDFDIEAGVRKLSWGKADSMGPLDLINPLDYSDLSGMSDPLSMKIARPLVHLSYNLGSFTKLEGVFVPWFAGHRFAAEGRWVPVQMKKLEEMVNGIISQMVGAGMMTQEAAAQALEIKSPDTQSIDYAQGGARFTTTIASIDFGIQYYYGLLPRPAVKVKVNQASQLPSISYVYNWFHQIGVDYAQVLAGFNLRAEFAANLTADTKGDKRDVYNPFLAWSVGFDRDIVWGVNLNFQGSGTIRLFDDKVGSGDDLSDLDTEAGTYISASRITANLSKKFLRDELELKVAAVWGIESKDVLIMPGLVLTKGDLAIELSGGIFAGDENGDLGQYRDNSFVYAGLTYSF